MTEQYPDNQHLIINVGRQIGSGGRIIARRLADEFGCRFFDREVLDLAACESGISQQFFEQSDEQAVHFPISSSIIATARPMLSSRRPVFAPRETYKSRFSVCMVFIL